jgi:hypothetical protein
MSNITQVEKDFLKRLIKMYGVDNAAVHFKNSLGYDAPEELLIEDKPNTGFNLNDM